MFLDWVASLDLLDHDPHTNILKGFSLAIRKSVTSQITGFLLDENTNVDEILPTETHVRWIMECIGQSFALPIEDAAIIGNGIEIYRRWLLLTKFRPEVMEGELLDFIEIMLQQLSLLFGYRSDSPSKESVETHAELCKHVLRIYLDISRSYSHCFSVHLTEVFLKLMVGIADSLLNPPQNMDGSLGRNLASLVLKVLLEVWLRSKTQNAVLWGSLRSLMQKWTYHVETVQTWSHTCLAVTESMTNLLYKNGKPCINLNISNDPIVIEMNEEYIYYLWERLIHCCGNINKIATPFIFHLAINGIHDMTKVFLQINKDRIPGAPDGNSILHIFGSTLFTAASLSRPGFEFGTSSAVTCLYEIFLECSNWSFNDTYLTCFYHSLAKAFVSPGKVLVAALDHAYLLLAAELPNGRYLVPFMNHAITSIYARNDSGYEYPMSVRKNCISLLSHLLALPNLFQTTPFAGKYPPLLIEDLSAVENYYDLEPCFGLILVRGLQHETDAHNIQLLLHHVTLFLFEFLPPFCEIESESVVDSHATVPQHAYFAIWTLMKLIVRKIDREQWPEDVVETAFRTLSGMCSVYRHIGLRKKFAAFLVTKLCELVLVEVSKPQCNDVLVCGAVQVFTDWLLIDNWLPEFPEVDVLVVKTYIKALAAESAVPQLSADGNKKSVAKMGSKASVTVQAMTQYSLCCYLNMGNNFPTSAGASTVSSLLKEEDFTDDVANNIKFFSLGGECILSIVNDPNVRRLDGLSSILILRDRTGKYVWSGTLRYTPLKTRFVDGEHVDFDGERPSVVLTDTPICTEPYVSNLIESSSLSEEEEMNQLQGLYKALDLGDADKNVVDILRKLISDYDKSLIANSEITMGVRHTEEPPRRGGESGTLVNPDAWMGRVLMAHLGLFGGNLSKGQVTSLENSVELRQSLKNLDETLEREDMSIAVLFVEHGITDINKIVESNQCSAEFNSFVSYLGWGVELETHKGTFRGLHNDGSTGTYAPYYATYDTEVIFHCAPLMDGMEVQDKQAIFSRDEAVIIWMEDGYDEYLSLNLRETMQPKTAVHIVISPLPSKLCRVNIVGPESSVPVVGPLVSQAILGIYSLGPMIRLTAINWIRALRFHVSGGSISPTLQRSLLVKDIVSQFIKSQDNAGKFSSFFSSKRDQSKTLKQEEEVIEG